jgi:integrase/recombinase XerD
MTDAAMIPANSQDEQVIALWLHGRPAHTQRAYRAEVARFRAHADKPLAAVTLGDLQSYADTLVDLAPASQSRALAALKSLFAFAHRLGFLPFDVGRAIRLPKQRNALAERILPEAAVQRMLAREENPRNRALLRLLYAGGLRVSEACRLRWRDLAEREEGGQVAVYGKGGKTRFVLLPASVWEDLVALRGDAGADAPVFRSRQGGGAVSPAQVLRVVRAAAKRAGIAVNVSPHWLRHAHASHSLDRGAPAHLVMATLGHSSLATTSRYTHARPQDSSGRYLAV